MKKREGDKLFRFHWFDGKTNDGYGRDAADAANNIGIGAGAIRALDYYEEIKEDAKVNDR